MSNNLSFAKKVFVELNEAVSIPEKIEASQSLPVIKSIDEFMTILEETNTAYNNVHQLPVTKRLLFSEEIDAEDVSQLNNNLYDEKIQLVINNYLPDMRIVTYTTDEAPGSLGQHGINETRFKNIKWKYIGYYDDPEYTGYSIIRYSRDIEANIKFKVWGRFFQDIRERAATLKEIIDTNIWYFKLKGLKDIIWTNSYEDVMYKEKGIQKYKAMEYTIRFSEIKEYKEKNLEQIVIQYGLES